MENLDENSYSVFDRKSNKKITAPSGSNIKEALQNYSNKFTLLEFMMSKLNHCNSDE